MAKRSAKFGGDDDVVVVRSAPAVAERDNSRRAVVGETAAQQVSAEFLQPLGFDDI